MDSQVMVCSMVAAVEPVAALVLPPHLLVGKAAMAEAMAAAEEAGVDHKTERTVGQEAMVLMES
jgi:hypothetical protein